MVHSVEGIDVLKPIKLKIEKNVVEEKKLRALPLDLINDLDNIRTYMKREANIPSFSWVEFLRVDANFIKRHIDLFLKEVKNAIEQKNGIFKKREKRGGRFNGKNY